MSEYLHFSAAASVKNLFGRGLVTDQVAAVFELVKNSYDADANEVHIVFHDLNSENATMTITDDGSGMDLDDIKNRWMVIGTDSKKNVGYSPQYHRALNGDKGIGRFSVDRLGSNLVMTAQKEFSNKKYVVTFDWSLFDEQNKNLNDIAIPYYIEASSESHKGVSLKIMGLRDTWDQEKIRNLYRSLRHLKSPFSLEDNFKIYITALEYGYDKREVVVEKLEGVSSLWLNAEVRKDSQNRISVIVNKDGLEYEEFFDNPYNFGVVKTQVFVFNQGDKIRFANRYGIRVRDYGNIRLYRDGFRIYPYGESTNDWLDIDRRQTQGIMRFLGTRDLIGYVQITKEDNPKLIPLTNRQGLEENDEYQQLKHYVINICLKTLESYYFYKIKKGTNETIIKAKVEIGGAVEGLKRLASAIKNENPDVADQINDYASTIGKQQESQIQYVKDQQEIVKVYSRIAQKETFLHKLIHQSMIHVQDANTALSNFINMNELQEEQKKQLQIVRDFMGEALSLLVTVRDDVVKKREKTFQNVALLAQKYVAENHSLFEESDIAVTITNEGDLLYNVDSGDIKAILNNLATNAVKSLKKISDRERLIKFELYKTDRYIIIKCIDNGVGIPEIDRERIFDPFQSTTGGFGLGLTIIDEIAKEYGGALELIETDIGACFCVKLRC